MRLKCPEVLQCPLTYASDNPLGKIFLVRMLPISSEDFRFFKGCSTLWYPVTNYRRIANNLGNICKKVAHIMKYGNFSATLLKDKNKKRLEQRVHFLIMHNLLISCGLA
jgi:hypothetical protein